MTARATQGGAYVGHRGVATARATQGGAYVGIKEPSVGARATFGGAYAGITVEATLRATQAGAYVGVRPVKPGCLTSEAQCWKLTRQDGTVYLYTAHDEDVVFRGERYLRCGSLSSSAFQTSAELGATENLDLAGIIGTDVTRGDIWAGIYDGAEIEIWLVDWRDPTQGELVAAATLSSVQFGTTQFKFEVTTAGQRLQQRPILQPVTATCRFKLGDARCSIDLEPLRVSGVVTAITSPNVQTMARRRIFQDTSRAEAVDYFKLGRVTITSGPNAGQSIDVKGFDADGNFILSQPLEYDLAVGVTYTAVPGCDLLQTTCKVRFNNAINFGGFPYLKGTDDLQTQPDVKT